MSLRTLDCLHMAFSTHATYHYLVELFGDYVGDLSYHLVRECMGGVLRPLLMS